MHVLGIPVDLNWLIQFIVTVLIVAVVLLHLVRNTTSRYFVVDADFHEPNDVVLTPSSSNQRTMSDFVDSDSPTDACAVCGKLTNKQCSGCKSVKYCSESCQRSHWNSGHKIKCKDLIANMLHSAPGLRRRKTSNVVPLGPDDGISNIFNQLKKILFPYEDFVELFNWTKTGFPPCGLLNCGNSCFANVVLQCLTFTRPLIAYLLDRGHRRECRRNDWCFLCEFQTHVETYSRSLHPFSPINILSRLPNIGGNLGYGRQEDAHEFMRFAIDTMQSVCLDEFGGEKAIPPSSQETTLIQHIFGGHLQSQVICTKCNNISSQFENMMDLTVEIHGDATSLEECLDQFTAREWLHGDNMYKCDGCNEYVIAWKHLSIRRAPNILTIALKRFQSGRFGKLNKRVTFPETLDLCPYMSQQGDGNDIYRLYGVVVHLDMLNASFFGHYICYIKDFCGNWYMVDDCKVHRVELDEVLSQGAYMLLYTRVCVHPSSLYPDEQSKKEPEMIKVDTDVESCPRQSVEQFSGAESIGTASSSGTAPSYNGPLAKVSDAEEELSSTNSIDLTEDGDKVDLEASSSVFMDVEDLGKADAEISHVEDTSNMDSGAFSGPFSSISNFENENGVNSGLAEECRLIDSPVKDRVTADFYVCEKGGKPQNISVAALGSGEISVGTVSVHCKGKLEKVETRNVMLASCSIKDAEGRLNGRDPKPKPLFTPGFLGKQKQDKVSIWEGKSTAELQELASNRDLSSEGNHGFSKPDVCLKSDGEKKHDGKSHFEGNISSNIVLKKQTEASVNEDVMVTNKSVESVSLSNVDCFIPHDAGERSSSVSMNEKKLVVVERNPVCAEFHGMAGTTLEKTGPNVKQEA